MPDRPSRLTVAMADALALLEAGHPPRIAASKAGVALESLYRAMRRLGIGERCPTCGRQLPRGAARGKHGDA